MCWGDNAFGQLGNGSDGFSVRPVEVAQGQDKAILVAAGQYHSCYLTAAGTVKCWGLNSDGQLGTGLTRTERKPTAVKDLAGVRVLDAGYRHTCAFLVDGGIKCWGNNLWSQLGTDDMIMTSSPIPLAVEWFGRIH